MNRREALATLLAVGAAQPLISRAQAPRDRKPARIASIPDLSPAERAIFVATMKEQGWTEGRDFTIVQYAVRPGPVNQQAMERLVAEQPDVIFPAATSYALAAHRLTTTIPIVMRASGYPVDVGLADSLARPGKNVTGNTIYAGLGLWGKLVQLLLETKPGIKRVGTLLGYAPPNFLRAELDPAHREIEEAARRFGLTSKIVEVATSDQVAAALDELGRWRPDALIVCGRPGMFGTEELVRRFAAARRLPTVNESPGWTELEPLLQFGDDSADRVSRAARYVVRILNGAKPGELPIQQPSRFELVVNLKRAREIGLNAPQSILVQATRVIE